MNDASDITVETLQRVDAIIAASRRVHRRALARRITAASLLLASYTGGILWLSRLIGRHRFAAGGEIHRYKPRPDTVPLWSSREALRLVRD